MSPVCVRAMHSTQRGAVTIIVTIVLLLAMTSLALFANKSVNLEQKTGANYYRYTQAFDVAEAGFDRAVARLQIPSLRALHIVPATGLINSANATVQVTLGEQAFRAVLSNPVPANPNLIQIISHGYADNCTTFDDACPMRSRVTQQILFRPMSPASIDAPLITKGNVNVGGNATIANTDAATGFTIRAAGTVAIGGSSNLVTPLGPLPDGAMDASVTASDAGLAALTNDQFIEAIFGDSKVMLRMVSEQFTCTGTDCNAKLDGIAGRALWVDGDVYLNANTVLGSATDPVILFVNGDFQLNGDAVVYGLVYAINSGAHSVSGNPTLHGALITENGFTVTGNATLNFDAGVMAVLSRFGTYAKVPGTWTDF